MRKEGEWRSLLAALPALNNEFAPAADIRGLRKAPGIAVWVIQADKVHQSLSA